MNKKTTTLNPQMMWITELALSLKENSINNIEIRCHNSNLYIDFLSNKYDSTFDGFKYLKQAIENKITIIDQKLNVKQITEEVNQCSYIILCVESSLLNNDNKMSGGHFIILHNETNGKVNVINPIKNKYEHKQYTKEELICFCKDYGSWRILIKEDTND